MSRSFRPENVRKIPATQPKRYRTSRVVHDKLVELAPEYGSLGRALQVATEVFCERGKKTLNVKAKYRGVSDASVTFKLAPRTIELIERMLPDYGNKYANVLAALTQWLEERKL